MKYSRILVPAAIVLFAGCIRQSMDPVEVSVGGRIKADAAYDTGQVNTSGNYAIWANLDQSAGDSVSLTPRETRVSVNVKKGDVSGKVEVDLYSAAADANGNTLAENKTALMLRHAFVKAKVAEGLNVVAGQTSDVFSPIVPTTLNYPVAWGAGNMGYRHPQLRVEYGVGPVDMKLSANSVLGGEDQGAPEIQGRIGYTLKNDMDKKLLSVGYSTVNGYSDAAKTNLIWGGALDLKACLGPVTLSGEYHVGQNLAAYLGGAVQGVSTAGPASQEIHTTGMWVQLKTKINDELEVNIGTHSDDPDQDDLIGAAVAAEARDYNGATYLNILWKINKSLTTGFEYSKWMTTWYDGAATYDRELERYQASLILTF